MSIQQSVNVRERWSRALAALANKRPRSHSADPWAPLWSLTPPF